MEYFNKQQGCFKSKYIKLSHRQKNASRHRNCKMVPKNLPVDARAYNTVGRTLVTPETCSAVASLVEGNGQSGLSLAIKLVTSHMRSNESSLEKRGAGSLVSVCFVIGVTVILSCQLSHNSVNHITLLFNQIYQ